MKKIEKNREKAVLVICGNVAQNILVLHQYLKMFQPIPIPKLFIAGNHDLWVEDGDDSLLKYLLSLKDACEDAGFHYLDQQPYTIDTIGFVGNIGWYDYSFKCATTGLTEGLQLIRNNTSQVIRWEDLKDEDYEAKTLMGEVNGNLFNVTTWNDKFHIHWSFSDKEFTKRCLYQTQKHISQIRKKVNHFVFCSHHIHFQEGIVIKNKARWDFNNAYMGSREIGDVILQEEKLRLVLFGHSHESGQYRIANRIPAFNVSFHPREDVTSLDINPIDGSIVPAD